MRVERKKCRQSWGKVGEIGTLLNWTLKASAPTSPLGEFAHPTGRHGVLATIHMDGIRLAYYHLV